MFKITKRIYAEGAWVASSPLHVGGEEDLLGSADMQLLRTGDGKFTIPGASIAGAARSRLAQDFAGDFAAGIGKEPAWMKALFGGGDAQAGTMSALIVPDAMPVAAQPQLRDGVAISHDTGQAEEGARYVVETLPAGISFTIRFELAVYDQPASETNERDLISGFRTLLELFQKVSDGVWLGAKTRSGFGRGHVANWKVAALDMRMKADVRRWLQRGLEQFTFDSTETLAEVLKDVHPHRPASGPRRSPPCGPQRPARRGPRGNPPLNPRAHGSAPPRRER